MEKLSLFVIFKKKGKTNCEVVCKNNNQIIKKASSKMSLIFKIILLYVIIIIHNITENLLQVLNCPTVRSYRNRFRGVKYCMYCIMSRDPVLLVCNIRDKLMCMVYRWLIRTPNCYFEAQNKREVSVSSLPTSPKPVYRNSGNE